MLLAGRKRKSWDCDVAEFTGRPREDFVKQWLRGKLAQQSRVWSIAAALARDSWAGRPEAEQKITRFETPLVELLAAVRHIELQDQIPECVLQSNFKPLAAEG